MTPEKILEVVNAYSDMLHEAGITPAMANLEDVCHPGEVAPHVLWMCEQVRCLVADGRIEKAFRWLGFMQGALWSAGYTTIGNARRANMVEGEEYK